MIYWDVCSLNLRVFHVEMTDRTTITKVVVATAVMLSFVSFWTASAIVLCDVASPACYAGGIGEFLDIQYWG